MNRKHIVRTSAIAGPATLGVHQIFGACSSRTVTDNENFHLNHYPIQSLEFFQTVKMTRGDASTVASDSVRDMGYFERYDAPCTKTNTVLADMVTNGTIS